MWVFCRSCSSAGCGCFAGAVTLFVGHLQPETEEDAIKTFFKKNGVKVKEARKIPQKR